jgi:nucleoside-diphosphate-sugar epimerase
VTVQDETAGAERFLITGAFGCIGAWSVRRLVLEGVEVWAYDLAAQPHRMRLIMTEDQMRRVHFLHGDITAADSFERAVVDHGITHIIHLAALQIPFVKADPIQGARVNVVGSTIVFETVRRHPDQVRGLSYASSAGVYGAAEAYPPGPLAHDAPLLPPSLYGVFKQAAEGAARIYWQDHRLPSVGLRPYVVYGPGRDQGMTSTPTKAMLAAALGRPYHISYGGSVVFQHADDAASAFIAAARATVEGAPVYNLGGSFAAMESVVSAIEAAAPSVRGRITFEPRPLPLPADIDAAEFHRFLPEVGWRPLGQGVAQTVEHFRQAHRDGLIDAERVLSDAAAPAEASSLPDL